MKFEKAKKIWTPSSGVNTYADFSARFAKGDRVRVSCDGNYALCINGSFVDAGQYPGYEDLQFFDDLDISPFVKDGENELLIIAHHPGVDFSTYRNKPPFVIFEVTANGVITAASGEGTLCRADPNYAFGEGVGKVSSQLGFTFGYDSTADETEWIPARVVEGCDEYLPRPVEKLRIGKPSKGRMINVGSFTERKKDGTAAGRMQDSSLSVSAVDGGGAKLPSDAGIELKVRDGDGIAAIIDLGAESAGFMTFDVEVPEACEILVGWGEHLADLKVRTSIGNRNFAARYLAKAGRNTFENPLLRLGLRFIQIHIFAKTAKIHNVGIRPTDYPLPAANPCPIGDRLHKMIYDVCVRTLELCMHEHYEDCPWREQSLYTMDSRNQMLCGYIAFGETRFPAASLRLIAHSLREDGMLELCSPARVPITIPCFSAIFIVQLFEYLEFSGDEKTAKELLPTAKKIAETFASRLENGLIACFAEPEYWNFYEWQTNLNESRDNGIGYDAPLSAFVSMAFGSLSKLCERLGDPDSERYLSLRNEVNKAAEIFYDAEKGVYASYLRNGKRIHFAELTNSLLVCAGAVPEERLGCVLEALKSGGLIAVTLSHSIFKYDALLSRDGNEDFVMNDIAEKFGHMLTHGATSFWETIEGDAAFGKAGSLCHGWSAVPVYVYDRVRKKV